MSNQFCIKNCAARADKYCFGYHLFEHPRIKGKSVPLIAMAKCKWKKQAEKSAVESKNGY